MVVGDDVAVDAINELYCQTYGTKPNLPWRQKGFPPRSVFRSSNSHKISYDFTHQKREGKAVCRHL